MGILLIIDESERVLMVDEFLVISKDFYQLCCLKVEDNEHMNKLVSWEEEKAQDSLVLSMTFTCTYHLVIVPNGFNNFCFMSLIPKVEY